MDLYNDRNLPPIDVDLYNKHNLTHIEILENPSDSSMTIENPGKNSFTIENPS